MDDEDFERMLRSTPRNVIIAAPRAGAGTVQLTDDQWQRLKERNDRVASEGRARA